MRVEGFATERSLTCDANASREPVWGIAHLEHDVQVSMCSSSVRDHLNWLGDGQTELRSRARGTALRGRIATAAPSHKSSAESQ